MLIFLKPILTLCRIWAVFFGIGLMIDNATGHRNQDTGIWLINIGTLVVWWIVTVYMLIGRSPVGLRVAIYLAVGLLLYIVGVISIGYWLVFIRQIPGRTGSDMLCAALVGLPALLPLVLGAYLRWQDVERGSRLMCRGPGAPCKGGGGVAERVAGRK